MNTSASLFPIDTEFAIGYRHDQNGGMKEPHLHNQYEMFLCLSNGVNCLIEDKIYSINAGTLVLFDYNCLHKVTVSGTDPYVRYVINFKRTLIEEFSHECVPLLSCFCKGGSVFPLSCSKLKLIKSLFSALNKIKTNQSAEYLLKRKLLLAQLLLEIGKCRLKLPLPEIKVPDIAAILTFIAANISERILIDDLCKRFYISRSSLTSKFKKATGTTINRYITGLRLSKASELLSRGESTYRVCEICGFPDQSHFIRVFTAQFHCSPGRYRRQNRAATP